MIITKTKYQNIIKKTFSKNNWKSFAILIIGIVLTIAAAFYTKKDLETQLKHEFALVCNEIKTKISTRLYSHAQLLRSGSSFFAASDTISRNDWKIFNDHSKLNKNLPGIQGFGFSYIIKKEQLQQHIQKIKKEGFPEYTVRPAGDREIYTSIIYLEPFTDRNLRAFGFDMYSEPIRRKAMEQARDFDVAALSGKVVLVQETDKDLQAGTLMYVPVYKNGMPKNTIEERRAAITGWVYSPYRMFDLMQGILGGWDLNDNHKIHLQVYDNDSISENSLLFDSQKKDSIVHNDIPNQTLTIPIVFNDKMWTLRFSQSNREFSYFQSKVLIVFFSGLIISVLLFSLSLSLFNTQQKAQRIAEQLTSELKESEKRFSLFMDYLPAIVFLKDNEGKTLFVNKYMDNAVGASKWLGKNMVEVFPNEFGEKLLADDFRVMKLGYEKIDESIMQFDGKVHSFETQKFIIPRQEQEPFLGGISLDITERKQAEEALKLSEERLHLIFETANVGIVALDKLGKFSMFNKMWLEMSGYSDEELKSLTNIEITHNADREQSINIMNELRNGKIEKFRIEKRYIRKDKSIFWADVSVSATKNNYIAVIIDITERKQAEEELKISHSRLNLALQIANMSWWEMDFATGNVTFDKRKAEMLDYLPEMFKHYNDFVSLIHPEDYERTMNAMRNHLAGKVDKYEIEYRIKNKSGEYKWFYDIGQIVNNNLVEGSRMITGLVIDITERKQAEEALLESEARFKNLFEKHSSVMLLINPEKGKIINANKSASDFYGYSIDELCEKTIDDINTLPANRIAEERELAIQEQRNYFIFSHKLSSGIIRTVEVHSTPIVYGAKKLLFSIVHDITERKQAEEALIQAKQKAEDSEKHIRLISDNLINGMIYQVIILDETNRKFIYLSDNVGKYYGCTANEAKENPSLIYDRTHPDDLQRLIDSELKALKSMSDFNIEIRIIHPDNSIRWFQIVSKPRKYNELVFWDGILFDITELKEAERLLKEKNEEILVQNEEYEQLNEELIQTNQHLLYSKEEIQHINSKLSQLNADKDRFIAILAHDLKSPFNSILGFLDLLTENIRKYDIDKIEDFINIINNSAKTTFNLLEDILMWVRANSGKIPFVPQMLNFGTIYNEVIENLKLTANTKSITINHFAKGDIKVFADKNMLNTILRNLVSNSIKFTNINGQIDVYAEKTQTNVIITVSDNGVGIEPETLTKLFEISQKISTEGTANEKGTGLGLLLCKEFVEKHSGKIWVESELGKGSSFKFTMPLCNH